MRRGTCERWLALRQMASAGAIYAVHRALCEVSARYVHSVVRWYLADFLAPVVCIPIFVNAELFFGLKRGRRIILAEALGYAALFAVYFELVGPRFIRHFTADAGDALAYFLGAMALYLSQDVRAPRA